MNKIFMRRANKIVVSRPKSSTTFSFAEVASLDANLRTLGYALSADLAKELLKIDASGLAAIAGPVVAAAKQIKGVKNYRPMYPNFPTQVMEASDAELYFNAIMHYFGDAVGLRIMPKYSEKKRPELDYDPAKVTVLGLGTEDEYNALILSLVNSKAAWSEQDREDIKSELTRIFNFKYTDFTMPNRENKATLVALLFKHKDFYPAGKNALAASTATDVLRLAVALSDGDVSLAEKPVFKNFSRRERRILLGALNGILNPQEDMLRHEAAWKRLGERLHPGEYRAKFDNAFEAFDDIRNNAKGVETFNSKTEALLKRGASVAAAKHLANRPGEFVRRLDQLLRNVSARSQSEIMREFDNVGHLASATSLLQARAALLSERGEGRVFFPKGRVSKFQYVDDTRTAIDEVTRVLAAQHIERALHKKFAELDSMGKVYVDPALAKVAIPFALRNASKGRSMGRGSRLPIDASTGTLRFFVWWRDIQDSDSWTGRVDVDLSAVVLDENFNSVFDLTYYNLSDVGGVHSGDITSAPNGASEFIDINLDKVRKRGGRYVMMTLHNYTGQKFSEVPEVLAGYMERKGAGKRGEIYDPRTVTNRIDVTAPSRQATPFIFDLETNEAIWVDLSVVYSSNSAYRNVGNTKNTLLNMIRGIVGLTPPNLYDLFALHAEARGELVETPEEADVVFGPESAYDVESILDTYV